MKKAEVASVPTPKTKPTDWKALFFKHRTAILAGVGVLVVLVIAYRVFRGAPRGSGFGREAPAMLAQASIQEELNLSTEQFETVKVYNEKLETANPNFFNLSKNDQEKFLNQQSWVIEKDLAGILSEEQFKRLRQIYIQRRGTRAWSDDYVIDTLGLSKSQRNEIAAVLKNYGEKRRDVFGGQGRGGRQGQGRGGRQKGDRKGEKKEEKPKEDPEVVEKRLAAERQEAQKKSAELREAVEEELMGILSPDQQVKWKDMLGEPFKSDRRGGGGGGRGRGNAPVS